MAERLGESLFLLPFTGILAHSIQLASLLEQKAVLLRLEAGSTEAGFLSAFCSISDTPTFVVIQYVPWRF